MTFAFGKVTIVLPTPQTRWKLQSQQVLWHLNCGQIFKSCNPFPLVWAPLSHMSDFEVRELGNAFLGIAPKPACL